MGVTKGGRPTGKPLTGRDIGRIVKALGTRARLAPNFSAHSLRVGMTQDLVAANLGIGAVMLAGGWRSTAIVPAPGRRSSCP
jgi:hypothetical protein